MNSDLEYHIRKNYLWNKLPHHMKQQLGQDQKEYEKVVFQYSVKNQMRYRDNLIQKVFRNEQRYYDELLKYSRKSLMLYPYHLQDIMVKGLRTTPFAYYVDILQDIMTGDKSYDSLPNFTAADCLRLLGIGRNQYIDLMNQCRGTKKFLGVGLPRRRNNVKDLLPTRPISEVSLEPWWIVRIGWVTEEDVRGSNFGEKKLIDHLIDNGPCRAGTLDHNVLKNLYQRGLVYIEVPIENEDYIVVPTLEGFVMNRVTGDYFETLLYKIFVSIDEHTTVEELATVLQIDLQQVKNAISLFCRLGFAYKKSPLEMNSPSMNNSVGEHGDEHQSWKDASVASQRNKKTSNQGTTLIDWTTNLETQGKRIDDTDQGILPSELVLNNLNEDSLDLDRSALLGEGLGLSESTSMTFSVGSLTPSCSMYGQKLAFLFDSTLTAYLMMGNLSPGLKNHAVTMFEVGKLSDESVENFLSELDRVVDVGEGEARRYYEHAVNLRETIRRLRHNSDLVADDGFNYGLDLLRCASLLSLDPSTRSRILSKNYQFLISMAPLSFEDRTITSCEPLHLGPPIPEVNSAWFKLFLYHLTQCGPPSLLLVKGARLRRLPEVFYDYERLLITTWSHDAALTPVSNVLLTVNDALNHNPVLIQAYDGYPVKKKSFLPFPLKLKQNESENATAVEINQSDFNDNCDLPIVKLLCEKLDLESSCGYITILKTDSQSDSKDAVLLDLHFGVPLFSSQLNQRIVHSIAHNQLLSADNSDRLLTANRKLVLQLLKFITDVNGENRDSDVPYPSKNLFFNGQKLVCLTSI